MMKKCFCVFAFVAALYAGTAITQEKKSFTADFHKDKGLDCGVCHKESPPKSPVSGEVCLPCHTSMEAVAERTKNYERNPHRNHLTDAMDVPCTDCHQGHKANKSVCEQCHAGMKFEKKVNDSK